MIFTLFLEYNHILLKYFEPTVRDHVDKIRSDFLHLTHLLRYRAFLKEVLIDTSNRDLELFFCHVYSEEIFNPAKFFLLNL